ncbi:MAG: pyruvate dehydrogenase (acetyl-transferring) E1 component subunit alpha [Thaumarchaeota archaeon]|nr:pyruvate dehydrogenase (acetyl-transferring) E1 component subunit alpha [Candidatus Calditenuaceae archaeon]MDW8186571.1 pyruvate dehydrogenase (acetyl-transferring) E1 component subunit alpha [Nitrososphaerota archaeon]
MLGGKVLPDPEKIGVSSDDLLKMYKAMVLTRVLDRYILRLQRMGKVALYAESLGEEAVEVGVTQALQPRDVVFPTYRELGIYLTRGVPVAEILDRMTCTVDDPLKGHEFAIFGDKRFNIVPAPTPVSTQIPLAVGYAMAAKLKGEKMVVLTIFGDGATSKGDFHEGLNFASVHKPPVVFVCRNNQYAISTHISKQTGSSTIAQKAVAYGLEGVRVDGNDVLAVYLTTKAAVDRIREGAPPVLIEALTYRMGAHTTSDDPKRYRTEDETQSWAKLDPVSRMRDYLISKGVMDEEADSVLRSEVEREVAAEVEKVLQKSGPDPLVIFEDVYSDPPWTVLEQMEELKRMIGIQRVVRR